MHSLQYLEYSNGIEDINPELPGVCCDRVDSTDTRNWLLLYTVLICVHVKVHVLVNLLLDQVIGHFISHRRTITWTSHRK